MPEFTCTECGATFSLPDATLGRFPGWTPKRCRACRDAGAPPAARRLRGRQTPLVEQNLPVAEVLARYTEGPADGVFTDGSANPNPGPGGWGAVYVVGGQLVAQDHGAEKHTTNNRMELTALIAGFGLVPEGTPATVYSDSRLCVDTITQWAPSWERNGWRRKSGPVLNLDLVKLLYARAKARPELSLQWIAGHGGSRWNEYADALSTAYLREEL